MSDANSSLTIRVGTSGVGTVLADFNSITAGIASFGTKLAAAFGIGFGISEFVRLTAAAINSAEAMGRLSKQTDFSVSTLEALRKQTDSVGLEFSDLGQSMGIFVVKMQEAREKGGAAMDVFRELGHDVAMAVMQGRPAEKVYGMIAQKFHEGAVAGREQAVAHELFGRQWKQWIPILNEGTEGLEKFRALGGGITPEAIENATQFNRSLRDLKEQASEIVREFATGVLPTLQSTVDWLKNVNKEASGTANAASGLIDVFKGIVTVGIVVGAVFVDIGKDIGYAVNIGVKNATMTFELLKKIMADVNEMAKETIQLFIDLASAVLHSKEAIGFAMAGHFGAAREIIADDLGTIKKDLLNLGGTAKDIPETVFGAWGQYFQNGIEGWTGLITDVTAQWASASKFIAGMWSQATLKPPGAQGTASTGGTEATGGTQAENTQSFDIKGPMEELTAMREKVLLNEKLIQDNPLLTEQKRIEGMLPLYKQQNYLISQQIALLNSVAHDDTRTKEEKAKAEKEISQLQIQQVGLTKKMNDGQMTSSITGQFALTFRNIQNQWGTFAGQLATSFQSVFNTAISSISNGITGLIMGTKTWKQALMEIGNTILTSIIGAIVQMGVRWVLTQIMMAIFGKVISAAATAALIPLAAAQVKIWSLPAVLSTIASAGATALAAPAEIGAAWAMTLAGFDEGGWTGGKRNEPAGIVHGEEFVFSAPSVDRIGLDTLQAMHRGATVAGSRSTAGSSGGSAAGGQKNSPVNLHFYDSRPHPKDFLSSSEGENMVVNIARKNRLKIGVGT